MMKKLVSLWLVLLMILPQCIFAADLPDVRAKGAVLIEQESGRILFEKNAFEPLAMASTTKIMTCILALEKGNLDDIVTASKRATKAPPTKLHLKVGEKQRLGDLLRALMLESDNDVAVVVAEHIGGTVENFCDMMTQKAHEIGAVHASFKTPNGLDSEGHQASAHDMAIIAAYALKNPEFQKIVTTETYTFPSTRLEGSERHDLQNKNRFFYSYQGANGIKTGFTNKAGHCFVGGAKKNDMQLIAVSLGAGWGKAGKTRKYTDVINMMNYGFNNYEKVTVLSPSEHIAEVPVEKALVSKTELNCNATIVLPLNKEEKEKITLKKVLPTTLKAPIKAGQEIGEIQILCDDVVLAKAPMVTSQDIKKATVLDYIKDWISKR